ncbi:MAG TPA: hypothetical protein EYG40_11850 [Verrucomicrobia bacterium]|nr:hypothetical protein [Verrucomicrobiales bacterium]HIL55712.1 hypothetical protein [Verrucomicrobiota bacterium]
MLFSQERKNEKGYLDNPFWGALVYASNGKIDKPLNAKLSSKLKKAFPTFQNFELLGQHTQENVFKEYVNWVVPSNEINLGFESKGLAEGGGVKLLLKLWRKKKVILKSDLIIYPDKPVLISGPEWKEGRLIFVLEMKKKK